MSPTPSLKPSLNVLQVSNSPIKMKKLFLLFFLLSFLLLSSTFLESATAKPVFCYEECKKRCSRAGYRERCMKYCGICCVKCKCVPSGTYGNKHECSCYRDLRKARGKPKCP